MTRTNWWPRRRVRTMYLYQYAIIGGVGTALAILLMLACAVLLALGGAL